MKCVKMLYVFLHLQCENSVELLRCSIVSHGASSHIHVISVAVFHFTDLSVSVAQVILLSLLTATID